MNIVGYTRPELNDLAYSLILKNNIEFSHGVEWNASYTLHLFCWLKRNDIVFMTETILNKLYSIYHKKFNRDTIYSICQRIGVLYQI